MGIVAGFKTSDGTFFEKEIDADEYEQNLLIKYKLKSFLINLNFDSSKGYNLPFLISEFIVRNKKDIMKILGE